MSFGLPSHPATSLVRIIDKGSIGFLLRNTIANKLGLWNMQVLIVTVATILILSWVPIGDTARSVVFCVLYDVLFGQSVTLRCQTDFGLCQMWASS